MVLYPEAGRRTEICLPGAGSVGEPAVAVWALGVWLLKNYIGPYSDQVPHHLSPLSSKSLIIQVLHWPNHVPLLFTNLGFSFPVLSPSWKVFLSTISTLYDLLVFLASPRHRLGSFSSIDCLVRFSFLVSYNWVERFFTSDMILLSDSSASLRD